ncbi:fibronectin type III domain-containing protein [Roseburia rectibacter]|uniref:fibronectin type III domain-containing protein n=1 Tax=Roseburia rectibacter TaxID=2763062 RepID=UPI00164A0DE1|nr:fibronectin type III domain-containing protein [Roseburia rectibacter]UMY99907.1 fibronectin type III domain-containing protein [Roseburia rectibacter]
MVETQAATKVGNTKITSITQTGKKSVKVAFKKVSGAKGYTLQYRTAGGSWKTKNVTKNKLTISKLSTGKTYQFRVRAYKNVNGKKKYGKYSGVKKITVRDYVYLVDTYEPYNSYNYEAYTNGNYFKMGGKEQKKSFTLGQDSSWDEKFANFNIEGKYNKLTFKVGKMDGAGNHGDFDVKIYSEGQLV